MMKGIEPVAPTGNKEPILVLGIGNPLLRDDGVGVHAMYLLRDTLPERLRGSCGLEEAAVGGLAFLDMIYDTAM